MIYIIDANNLAGRMGLLGQDNFAENLSELFRNYKPDKNHLFYLVFDSNDFMGDQYQLNERIRIIYSPRDDYYKNADNKIVELAEKCAPLKSKNSQVIIVSDDIEIKEKINNLNLEKNLGLVFEGSSEFYLKLQAYFEKESIDNEDELSEDDEDEVNKELFKIWK